MLNAAVPAALPTVKLTFALLKTPPAKVSVPALTTVAPVYTLVPVRSNSPKPTLVRPPAPAMLPLSVSKAVALVMSNVAAPTLVMLRLVESVAPAPVYWSAPALNERRLPQPMPLLVPLSPIAPTLMVPPLMNVLPE